MINLQQFFPLQISKVSQKLHETFIKQRKKKSQTQKSLSCYLSYATSFSFLLSYLKSRKKILIFILNVYTKRLITLFTFCCSDVKADTSFKEIIIRQFLHNAKCSEKNSLRHFLVQCNLVEKNIKRQVIAANCCQLLTFLA